MRKADLRSGSCIWRVIKAPVCDRLDGTDFGSIGRSVVGGRCKWAIEASAICFVLFSLVYQMSIVAPLSLGCVAILTVIACLVTLAANQILRSPPPAHPSAMPMINGSDLALGIL